MKREDLVMVRLTTEQKERRQPAADAAERTLADWVRVPVEAQLGPVTKEPKRGGHYAASTRANVIPVTIVRTTHTAVIKPSRVPCVDEFIHIGPAIRIRAR